MPSITFDAQSFTIDGKRTWLVSGTVEYTRLPRELWGARIADARAAGFNCVTTSVVWARHEARAGQFNFEGENDLRHFVQLVQRAGMYVVLRCGPFVGTGFDMGGLPPWLLGNPALALRTANQPFLEASSRFIDAVARQVRDLQVTAPDPERTPQGGPIIAIQSENHWTCGHDQLALGYLGELNRYLRESGFEVPFLNANDLWAGVEGEVDGWTGTGAMLPHLRQLAQVRPSQPRVVAEYRVGQQHAWGERPAQPAPGFVLQRGLAEVLSAGAQFNIEPLVGGTSFGFSAGRLAHSTAAFAASSADRAAPIGEDGVHAPHYPALRRIAMFASRFGRLLAHLDAKHQSVCLLPPGAAHQQAAGKPRKLAEITPGGHVVVDAVGTQGAIVFIFAPTDTDGTPNGPAHDPATLLLPDGTILPVHLGEQPVAWVLLNTRLVGRSQLDYCNLSAFALAGRVFVCSGPAGAPARLSINGAELHTEVPEGDQPLVIEHEGVIVCIASDAQLPRLHVGEDAIYMGVDGLSLEGKPIVASWGAKFRKLSDTPEFETVVAEEHPKPPKVVEVKKTPEPPKGKKPAKGKKGKPVPPPPPPPPPAPLPPTASVVVRGKPAGKLALSPWQSAGLEDYLDGSGPRYASIAGPADLNTLGAPYGYGWYRLTFRHARGRRVQCVAPHSADRLALFEGGHALGMLGSGPGAEPDATIKLDKGEQSLVILAENLGRFAEGAQLGESKGLFGHVWEVSPIRLGRAAMRRGDPLDVLAFRAPLWQVHQGESTEPTRLTWTLPRRKKGPIILTLRPGRQRGLLLINDRPHAFFDQSGPSRFFIDETALGRGAIEVQIAVLGDADAAAGELRDALGMYQCEENLTARAEWAFAKWELPTPDRFSVDHKRHLHVPRWWKTTFTLPAGAAIAPLAVDLGSMSKGQVYVNGRHLARYFTATAANKRVTPGSVLHIPRPWVQEGRPTELMIFDEHGFPPVDVRVSGR
ncbi:MAG: beta-galactosidase [Phycisphaerales bacterium]